jgi:toxin ParE1/3/4
MSYRLLDAALRELLDAFIYYTSKDRRLASDLEWEIERPINFLIEFPRAAKPIDRHHRSYRLRRFPYALIYRVEGKELVFVAVAHTARKPGYWLDRSTDSGA